MQKLKSERNWNRKLKTAKKKQRVSFLSPAAFLAVWNLVFEFLSDSEE
jgi:hypothetical protein